MGKKMTAEKLNQYRAVRGEIADLTARKRRFERGAGIISDTVRGSSAAFPYTEHVVKITGVSAWHVNRIAALERMRRRREAKARALLLEIETFLAEIDDARARRVIELHYIKGRTWREVARTVYGSPLYESAARKFAERFIKNS